MFPLVFIFKVVFCGQLPLGIYSEPMIFTSLDLEVTGNLGMKDGKTEGWTETDNCIGALCRFCEGPGTAWAQQQRLGLFCGPHCLE